MVDYEFKYSDAIKKWSLRTKGMSKSELLADSNFLAIYPAGKVGTAAIEDSLYVVRPLDL